jgi:hypothetical protein
MTAGRSGTMDQHELMITMEEKPKYLYVYASGIRSRETVNEITMKIFHTALERHISKVLVDIRDLNGNFGIKDIFDFVTGVIKDLRGKGIDQVAILDVRRSSKPGWLLEPVAQSRGFNFRVFADDELAKKWLGE